MKVQDVSKYWQLFRSFLVYARPDRSYVIFAVVTILGLTVTNTTVVWLIGTPFDQLQEGQFDEVKTTLLWLFLLVLVNQGFHFSSTLMANWLGLRFVGRLRLSVLKHLLEIYPAASAHQRGDLLARLSNDVDKVQSMALEVPLFLVSHLLTLLFYGAMLFWIDASLAMIALGFVPLFYLHQHYFGPRKQKAAENFFHDNGELLAFEEQALANSRGISAFKAESQISNRHSIAFEKARHWAMRMRWLDQGFGVSLATLVYLCGIAIVFAGIGRIQQAGLSIGALVSFLIYLGYLSVPVRGLAQAPMQWLEDYGAALRVRELMDMKSQLIERDSLNHLEKIEGEISFNDVGFAYPNGDELFKRFNLNVKAGETVAIVGSSGVGKSTLVRLLMRFHDPQQGRILIDGKDIRDVSLVSLRKQLSVVWQDPFFINDTIRTNLLLAYPTATDTQLVAACGISGAWEFMEELGSGLDTKIGSGGIELSGGQRQRLAIAQAILRNSPILVLDESTSALDSFSEMAVAEALRELREGRTTLIIAHRFSSVRHADRVAYFNEDGSVNIGTHEELYISHRPYREAYAWQEEKDVAGFAFQPEA